jgi:2-polyprenyl-3-methyl-5-hydroxy-6-metoxy-1,4-benzoquinol methylase
MERSQNYGTEFTNDQQANQECRFCGAVLTNQFVDLGLSPLCQTQITPSQANIGEVFYPLRVLVCNDCFLVQLDEYVKPDVIFSEDYPYYSSYSDSWVQHARSYVDHVKSDFGISNASFVVEIASNDGYLLQHLVNDGIPCLGIEPAEGVAQAARDKGINTVSRFFGAQTAKEVAEEYGKANLVLGNNVLAHVPDLNDFVSGLEILVSDDGMITMEFPHLLRLMEQNQFDTIYHEHFSYFSFSTVNRVFAAHNLRIFDVQELPTHGGSIRIYACKKSADGYELSARATDLLKREDDLGMNSLPFYQAFATQVRQTKHELLAFLIDAKKRGKSIVGYGAPGKGNTLLNYCGIRQDFLDYTVDRSPHKQNTYTPGTRIPIYDPSRIYETKPDYILILPWNLKKEISSSMSDVSAWGGKFVVPIPRVEILD